MATRSFTPCVFPSGRTKATSRVAIAAPPSPGPAAPPRGPGTGRRGAAGGGRTPGGARPGPPARPLGLLPSGANPECEEDVPRAKAAPAQAAPGTARATGGRPSKLLGDAVTRPAREMRAWNPARPLARRGGEGPALSLVPFSFFLCGRPSLGGGPRPVCPSRKKEATTNENKQATTRRKNRDVGG